jgi:hypothetical protein
MPSLVILCLKVLTGISNFSDISESVSPFITSISVNYTGHINKCKVKSTDYTIQPLSKNRKYFLFFILFFIFYIDIMYFLKYTNNIRQIKQP